MISIISFYNKQAECILSCSRYYYRIIIRHFQDDTSSIEILSRFARYPECQAVDKYLPEIVRN
jgi:hypothetical protein